MRYDPGSLLMVVSPSRAERDRFVQRVIEDRSAVLSLDKVRALLAGRVPDEDVEARAAELLDAATLKRLQASETVVLAAEGVSQEERDRFVRLAAGVRRPRHLILLEARRDQVAEEDRPVLNDLRRALDAGEMGSEGFNTSLRLGGATIDEVKRILFRPPPRDE
jgi:predicted kinase